MRVLTILARFGTDQYPDAQAQLASIFDRCMSGVRRTHIVVDNALTRGVVERKDDYTLLGGDNRAFEFSAFDRAIEFVGADIWSYDLVHFATSAFNTLYTAYLERFHLELLEAMGDRPVCVGHIDCYNEPVEIFDFQSQHWVRSCFFVMPPTEVMLLGSMVSISAPEAFLSGRPEAPFRPDAPISDRYKRYITDWLTGRDIGQGVEWHSRFTVTHATLPTFERKALSIMNEHLLAIRLQAAGCQLVDVTWLSTVLAKSRAADIAWRTPWRTQLAARDRDALRISDPAETVHATPREG